MVLLVAQLKPQAAQVVAINILRAIRTNSFNLNVSNVNVTLSIGVAYSQPEESLKNLFKRADTALYRAKQGGRNTTVEVSSTGKYTDIEQVTYGSRCPESTRIV